MPIVKTTISREEMDTISRLNAMLRVQEDRDYRLMVKQAVRHETVQRQPHICDACQRGLNRRCWNVVVDMDGATLSVCRPVPDSVGSVVLRYHDRCYPKKLVENLSAGYHSRRCDEVEDRSEV